MKNKLNYIGVLSFESLYDKIETASIITRWLDNGEERYFFYSPTGITKYQKIINNKGFIIEINEEKRKILESMSKIQMDLEDVELWAKSIEGKTEEEIFGPLPLQVQET